MQDGQSELLGAGGLLSLCEQVFVNCILRYSAEQFYFGLQGKEKHDFSLFAAGRYKLSLDLLHGSFRL